MLASVLSATVALQLGAFSVVLETLLSGRSELPFGAFALLMQPIHLAIGLVEGFVTAGIIGYVRAARPEILAGAAAARPVVAGVPLAKMLAVFVALTILTGGALSWFASTRPDGLEWAIEKVTGKGELPEPGQGVAAALKGLQEKTAFLPDYGFKPAPDEPSGEAAAPAWPGIEAGTSLAGVTGAAIVLCLVGLIGLGIRFVRRRDG
jgi:cobalt/nickel transport system permease protein